MIPVKSAAGGASTQFLTLGECPAIYQSRPGAIPRRRSKKKMLLMQIDLKFHFNYEVKKQNKGSAEEDVDVRSHAVILALRIERSFGMIIDNRGWFWLKHL